jgi:hypothetical protein
MLKPPTIVGAHRFDSGLHLARSGNSNTGARLSYDRDTMHAVAVLLAALAFQTSGKPESVEALEREMVRLVNVERQARGLPVLELISPLAAAARKHSEILLASGKFFHEAGGSTMEDRTRKVPATGGTCSILISPASGSESLKGRAGFSILRRTSSASVKRNRRGTSRGRIPT